MGIPTKQAWLRRLLRGIALLAALQTPALAADAVRPTTAAAHRPAGVPADYVVTPFGYFHPSCVQEIRPGETLQADGRIRAADGGLRAAVACRHARFGPQGEAIGQNGPAPKPQASTDDQINGWVLDTELVTSSAYAGISANWTVPAAPASSDGQVVYFFPGLQDRNNVQSILQPVLGWNAFNDNRWTIASWNCCRDGAVNYSTPQATASGNQIVGTVQNNCAAGTATCTSWNIVTRDATRNVASTLSRTSNYGQTFNWAFGGVLEVYGVNSCDDYPSDGAMSFTAVRLLDVNKQPITQPAKLGWSANVLQQQAGCNLNAAASPTVSSLSY
ncbi:hypothetical protein CXB49_11095 [Chromobacterium sp. ATCC 53434]|uniref:hypothetical protein n=1 Tax=Chromobacterium TaxID=535 RepID=UPI000C78C372|nr:hypothetical protein [Chromobacterium sp. ATCC 53434]AUH51321.1 hypothetical protein CXB49_11095 [Chromobacterium sp. ATCC 53434]